MTCFIQQRDSRLFLSSRGTWTSDFNDSLEFTSVAAALRYKFDHALSSARVLVFRDHGVFQVDEHIERRSPTGAKDDPDLIPVS